MNFNDKTTFNKFEGREADKNIILAVMNIAYNKSSTAKEMFDDWFSANPNKKITFNFEKDTSEVPAGERGKGVVDFDLNYATSATYINNNGTVVKHSPVTVLIHELIHALTVKKDDGAFNDSGANIDYRGATVTYANKIYRELDPGQNAYPEQNSYLGQSDKDGILPLGVQYTNGAAIRSFRRPSCKRYCYKRGSSQLGLLARGRGKVERPADRQ